MRLIRVIKRRVFILIFLSTILFCMACLSGLKGPRNPEARPWTNEEQKVSFMLGMVHLIEPGTLVPDECSDRVARFLHSKEQNINAAPTQSNSSRLQDMKLGQPMAPAADRASEEEDSCRKPLQTCGNCHLPTINNCNYQVVHYEKDKKVESLGQVLAQDDHTITIGRRACEGECVAETNTSRKVIQKEDIVKTVWLAGADAPEAWWNFKKFSARGATAKKMLAIAQENNVSCANCHVAHGDFRLTSEGKEYLKTGKVIHTKPLH
ncbi:MAG TPA: hypothetical protein PKE49_15950 [Leptospiraceae bacterium]|nr:hypothetical protein [Leptospirales bacterium]HMU85594.1 hypothetical protein [Leptospiraceae bacterium]HMW60052.1 hypothetical protein [Leptospiraceae bacterium]HMX58016.1 hypothetical protein [Leptospiraceae bacterium]HMY44342.1 hypothetical protein [Leptospiraceae bacterium]